MGLRRSLPGAQEGRRIAIPYDFLATKRHKRTKGLGPSFPRAYRRNGEPAVVTEPLCLFVANFRRIATKGTRALVLRRSLPGAQEGRRIAIPYDFLATKRRKRAKGLGPSFPRAYRRNGEPVVAEDTLRLFAAKFSSSLGTAKAAIVTPCG